ncbi:MAG: hypothetical protein ABI120_12250 [Gemmatimonadaceae bacterium]
MERPDSYKAFIRPLAIILLIAAVSPGLAADPPAACTVDHVDATSPAASDKARALARKIETIDPCTIAPGVKVKSLRTLWANLVNGSRVGGKRFETPLPAGVPSGTVLAGPVRFDFNAVANEQPRQFVLTAGSQVIVDRAPPPPSYTLEHPSPETKYSWVLVTSRQSYKAKFDVLPEDESRGVASKLAALGNAVTDPLTRAFYEAAIYDDAGLYSNRDAVLDRIRSDIVP